MTEMLSSNKSLWNSNVCHTTEVSVFFFPRTITPILVKILDLCVQETNDKKPMTIQYTKTFILFNLRKIKF